MTRKVDACWIPRSAIASGVRVARGRGSSDMFSALKTTWCCLCHAPIDCHQQLHHFVLEGKVRYLCDECDEIDVNLEENDWLGWGFETREDYIRHVRKEQERGK